MRVFHVLSTAPTWTSMLDQYGTDDIGIGKCLCKVPAVNNDVFLKLAKADFNMCPALHMKELEQVITWDASCKFRDLAFARQKSVECFFSGAALMFEPEMVQARLVRAQRCVLTTVLDDYFDGGTPIQELQTYLQAVRMWDPSRVSELPDRAKILFNGRYTTVNAVAKEACIARTETSLTISNTTERQAKGRGRACTCTC